MSYLLLGLAIIAEVIATSSLKASMGMTRLMPSIVVVVGYCVSFYLLSIVLKTLPVGIAYALWAGLGIVLVSVIGMLVFGERPQLVDIIGIAMIIGGVCLIQLFSKNAGH